MSDYKPKLTAKDVDTVLSALAYAEATRWDAIDGLEPDDESAHEVHEVIQRFSELAFKLRRGRAEHIHRHSKKRLVTRG